jgi:CO dehydrogenase maturation factor
MIVTLSGKGGTGKTSLAALLLDEIAGRGYPGPVLAVDGDPASTLALALGLPEPPATVADVRDATRLDAATVRTLAPGVTPAAQMLGRLEQAGVIAPHRLRAMPIDLMALGRGEGPGCYCSINNTLARVLEGVLAHYALVVIDNEAGLEHLSRYRVKRVDLFLVVSTPGRAAWSVARRILDTSRAAGMRIGATGVIVNRAETSHAARSTSEGVVILAPESPELAALDREGRPVVDLSADSPLRRALGPIVDRVYAGICEPAPGATGSLNGVARGAGA